MHGIRSYWSAKLLVEDFCFWNREQKQNHAHCAFGYLEHIQQPVAHRQVMKRQVLNVTIFEKGSFRAISRQMTAGRWSTWESETLYQSSWGVWNKSGGSVGLEDWMEKPHQRRRARYKKLVGECQMQGCCVCKKLLPIGSLSSFLAQVGYWRMQLRASQW